MISSEAKPLSPSRISLAQRAFGGAARQSSVALLRDRLSAVQSELANHDDLLDITRELQSLSDDDLRDLTSRQQRLAWLGIDESTFAAASDRIVASNEAGQEARRLDRGFFHDPIESIGDNINNAAGAVLDPIIEADIPVISDLALLERNTIDSGVDIANEAASGVSRTGEQLLEGDLEGAVDELGSGFENVGEEVGELVVGNAAIIGNGAIDAFEEITGQKEERSLTSLEINQMRTIFGDSIDYSKVRIRTGSTRQSAIDRFGDLFDPEASAIGNSVFLPEGDNFNPDGSLTVAGQALLAHEMTHVWQFQRNGPGYIGESGFDQIEGGRDPYDWHAAVVDGVPFSQMGVEQQAELVEVIYRASLLPSGLNLRNFNDSAENSEQLTQAEFQIVLDALIFLSGRVS